MRQRNGRKNRAGCGNDGAVETMENQTTVFHRSHRSLEIRRTAPDSHIPTASTTGLYFSSRTRKPSRSSGALRARNPSSQLNNPANGEISPFRIILGLEYAERSAEKTGPIQAALDLSSSRMMRRSASSNLGAFPSRYSRSAALIRV